MKKFASILLMSALSVFAGCTMEEALIQEEQNNQSNGKEITLRATREDDPETRTVLESDGSVWWTPGDAISLFYGSGTDGGSKFTSNATVNSKVTNFTGVITAITGGGEISVDETFFWGVYPFRDDVSCDGSSVTMTLPSQQTAVPGTFATDLFPSMGRSQGLIMGFYNVCGGWRFSVTKEGVRKVTLKSNNGELITGKVKVGFDDSGIPEVREVIDGSDEVVLECPAGEYFEVGKNYYMILLPTTFSTGFTMTFETYTEIGVYNRTASTTVKRSKFSGITKIDSYLTTPYSIKDGGIPIEDDGFKDYLVGQDFDTDGDGEISYEEAETIETVEISTSDIESLSGIEYMTHLKTLICSGSDGMTRASGGSGQLTVLDVSNNTELEYLDCSDNLITSLDVSNNPALETLICTGNPMSEVKMTAGQAIADLQLPEGTRIVYDRVSPEMFPDGNFRTYVFDNFDSDGDGFLSEAEYGAVTKVVVNTDSISSLKGIEFFSCLTDLRCMGSRAASAYGPGTGNLTSLDLTENTRLKHIDCKYNKISTLVLPDDPGLVFLNCGYNVLTGLDVSGYPGLDTLYVYYNHLTSLDLSHNPSLISFDCMVNQLTSLDLSANLALDEANFASNQIESIDVTRNTELTLLASGDNPIGTLDVSRNVKLRVLSCYSNELESLDLSANPLLETLNANGNSFTSLDLSNAPLLRGLMLRNIPLTELDLSCNPNLVTLYCDNTQLASLDLSNNLLLAYLECGKNPFTSLDLSNHGYLYEVDCEYGHLTDLNVNGCTALERLCLDNNELITLDVHTNLALRLLRCRNNPDLRYIYLQEGQTIRTLGKPDGTIIEYIAAD